MTRATRTRARKPADPDLTAPRGSGLQTGDGQDPGIWYVFNTSPTGLNGGACYAPGHEKALAWQASENGDPYSWIDVSGTNPVFTAFTPTGDLPSDGSLHGATGVWNPDTQRIDLYTGSKLYSLDPLTEEFTEKTPSQAGANLAAFPNLSPATGDGRAIIGYLPEERLYVVAGKSNDDVWLLNPNPPASFAVALAMMLGL